MGAEQFELLRKEAITQIKTDLEQAVEADRLLAEGARDVAVEAKDDAIDAKNEAETARDIAVINAENIVNSSGLLIKNTKAISDIENTLSTANINQEAQVTQSGVDTIALPATAAATGMGVGIAGQSAKNLVVNGDFRDGTTGWALLGGANTMTITDKLTLNGTASASSGWYSDVVAKLGDKLYIAIKSTNEAVNFPSFRLYDYGTTANMEALPLTNSVSSLIALSKIGGVRFYIQQINGITYTNVTIDDVRIINLTATFGAGNEPTKEQCDILFANYFEGTANVEATGRVRSVGKNLFDKSRGRLDSGLNSVTGLPVSNPSGARSAYIRVKPNTSYIKSTSSFTNRYTLFDTNRNVILTALGNSFTTTENTVYVMLAMAIVDLDVYMFNEGSTLLTYEPYTDTQLHLTTPPLRSNGLIKDEIRRGSNGYELVKKVGVGELGSELITNAADREFSSDTGWWTKTTTSPLIRIEDGVAKFERVSNFELRSGNILTVGKKYVVEFTIKNKSGNAAYGVRSINLGFTRNAYSNGRYTYAGTATQTYFAFQTFGVDNEYYLEADDVTIKEIISDGSIATGTGNITLFGNTVTFTIPTPIITPIPHSGLLNSNPSGTVYFEPIVADAGVYGANFAIQKTGYPIKSITSLAKYSDGAALPLNTATAVIAGDGLTFTHPDLVAGDLVLVSYEYKNESIVRQMKVTHFDSRYGEQGYDQELTEKKDKAPSTDLLRRELGSLRTSEIPNTERALADTLAHLLGRIQTLEGTIRRMQFDKLQVNELSVVDNIKLKGSDSILFGTTAPAITPDYIGQRYIDTVAQISYTATGITNSANWKSDTN